LFSPQLLGKRSEAIRPGGVMVLILLPIHEGHDMHFVSRFRTAGLLALATISLPTLALAQTITVTDIAFESETGLKVSIPTLEAVGANLDEAAIRGLFRDGLAAAARTLGTLDAERIVIPTLTVTSPAIGPDGAPTSASYHDLELTGIDDGVATTATMAGAEVNGGAADTGTAVVMGKMSTGLLDLHAIIAFYGYADAASEMKTVYDDFVLDGMTFSGPGFACDIGAVRARTFAARPLKGSLEEVASWTAELEAAEREGHEPSPEAIKAAILYYVDILTAFKSTPITFDGFDCGGDDEGKPVTVTAGPLTIGGFAPGIYPPVGLDALRIEVGSDGWMEFGNFTWKAMDFSGPIALVKANADGLSPAWFEANWRELIPALEGLGITGFGMDIPGDAPDEPRITGRIGAFDLSLADYINGVPSTLASSASGISFTLPPDAQPVLASLGLAELVLGYNFAAKWDEPTRTIAVADLTFTGNGLGGVTLSGTIGNAGDSLFATDPDAALAAAMGLTVKQVNISIDNEGFVPALLALAAQEQGQTPQTFQVAAAGMAAALPLALLGGTPDAKALSGALGDFFGGAPNLRITLTANDPAGIAVTELMAAQNDPARLRGKVTVTASAEGEKVPFTYPDLTPPPAEPATPTPEAAAPTPEVTAPAPTEEPTRSDDKAGRKQ
jgi:hypothetical protein